MPEARTIGAPGLLPLSVSEHSVEVAGEPEQDAGGEEVEDHAGLEGGVMITNPVERFDRAESTRGCWG